MVFNRGVVVRLDRGPPNSFPAFSAWFQSVANGPLPPRNAGDQAVKLLPDSHAVADCQNHDLTADIDQLANDGLDVGRSSDATARQKVHADIKQFSRTLPPTSTTPTRSPPESKHSRERAVVAGRYPRVRDAGADLAQPRAP